MHVSSTAFIFGLMVCILCLGWVTTDDAQQQSMEVEDDKLEYAKGSLCGYCDYCRFCKLCDEDCPCDKSDKQPNCHMCKYCKYCYLCKVCDTICQPGGIIDRVSAAIVNALPSHDEKEIAEDLDTVKEWTDKDKPGAPGVVDSKRDEL